MATAESSWLGRPHVAVLAPCSGAAGLFPHMRAQGVARLTELTGLPVRLMPTALLKPGPKLSPKARAKDINDAFADANVMVIGL